MSPYRSGEAGAVDASSNSVSLVTLSYEGDLQLFQLLAGTIDKYAGDGISHYVAVPKKDIGKFKPFQSNRRIILPQEELLPSTLHRIPLPPASFRRRLGLPHRNFYTSPVRPVVGGWIVQQVMKIAFAAAVSDEVVVHVDSDLAFVKPFTSGNFLSEGRTRLFRVPNLVPSWPFHGQAFAAATRTLSVDQAATPFTNYIGSVIPWNKSCVRRLVDHIETTRSECWSSALLRSTALAEYMLYGVFCEYVLGLDQAGHVGDSVGFCETVWTDGQYADPSHISRMLLPEQIAVGLQSTLRLDLGERMRILDNVSRTDCYA
jgi:hypothetical protein